jgi:16S rRNA (uracil1498-N3)-methyltransferase
MARLWRLFHDSIPEEAGARVALAPDEARHARRVLRLREGEAVCLFDGKGLAWEGAIESVDGDRVAVTLTRPAENSAEPRLTLELHQGLCRADRMEWILQKGTELGLASLHCHPTRRSELDEVGAKRLERWRRIVTEAAKQSGRDRIPEIVEHSAGLPPATDGIPSFVATLDEAAPALAAAAASVAGASRVRLAVGPESGFEPAEVEAAIEAGWRPVQLGPRTLRAETAAVVAIALTLSALGEMGGAVPD